MFEPPEIPLSDLLKRVRVRFGLTATEGEFLPVGNDSRAWSFRVALPLPTAYGSSIDRGDPFSLVAYPYFEGEEGGEVGLTATCARRRVARPRTGDRSRPGHHRGSRGSGSGG